MTDTSDSDDSGGNVVALHDDEIDRKVLHLRLAGIAIRKIGRELELSDKAVLASLDRALPQLTPEMRIWLYREDLARLDELMVHWYTQAKGGSTTATSLCVKLMERRSAMTGTDAPVRLDVVVERQTAESPGSTQLLLDMLNKIAAERGNSGEAPAPAG
jgi:hypothetical protein